MWTTIRFKPHILKSKELQDLMSEETLIALKKPKILTKTNFSLSSVLSTKLMRCSEKTSSLMKIQDSLAPNRDKYLQK